MKKKPRLAEDDPTPLRAINLFQVQNHPKMENSPEKPTEKAKSNPVCVTPEQKPKQPRPDLSRAAVKLPPK